MFYEYILMGYQREVTLGRLSPLDEMRLSFFDDSAGDSF